MCATVLFVLAAASAFSFWTPGAGAGTRRLTDQMGRSVEVPDDPQRVVSLAPSITEIVYAIGQGSRLKGATLFSDYPEEAARLPKVGSYVRLDLERIVSLRPDLCLAIKDGNPIAVVRRLEALGIPVYAVHPRDLESVMDTVVEMGNLLAAQDQARRLVGSMKTRVGKVRDLVGRTSYRPRVFFQIGISPLVSVGRGSFIDELIGIAGGTNVAEGPVPYPRMSKEQVLTLGPEVILITTMQREGAHEKEMRQWSRWTTMPAVRDRRIHLVDSNLFDRPTPRLIEALELLTRLLHPELAGEFR